MAWRYTPGSLPGTMMGWALAAACTAAQAWPGAATDSPSDSPSDSPAVSPAAEAAPDLVLANLSPAHAGRVEVVGRADDSLGSSDAASQGSVRAEQIRSRAALRPGELLEFIPGMVVTQHSGDGKANQYFLRGFNLDHGTDFATQVNGMPVNLPSHAHGQGYTDLNFVLPELVQRIDYRKGPYFAASGDFASAGGADIEYRSRLDAPLAQLTLGQHGYRRGVLGASNALGGGATTLLAAIELMANDGPWSTPEGLRRSNAVLTASSGDAALGWQASWMAYQARWTATDQVPQRLISAGRLDGRPFGRFDAVDTSDGGDTARLSLSGQWHRRTDAGTTRWSAYALHYRLQLYSNFSYALERPATGDQFGQHDQRSVLGLATSHAFSHEIAGLPARSELGLQWRQDQIRLALTETQRRQTLATTRDDAVRQDLLGAYGQTAVELAPWLRGSFGLRLDSLHNRVDSLSLSANSGTAAGQRLSPKLALVAGPFHRTEFFLNAGRGMHSNDARSSTQAVDPSPPHDPASRQAVLVVSRGAELGLRSQALSGLQSSLALWRLDFGSELVFSGDKGTTEASEASRRHGVEFNNRWAALPWLLLDADLAWTHARFASGARIPNAVEQVASLAATLRAAGPWQASLHWRYLGAGALTPDNAVRSQPALNANLRLAYALPSAGPGSALALEVFNLFDRRLNDIQYFYASRLPGEPAAVNDRHVHPAEPRSLRLTLHLGF